MLPLEPCYTAQLFRPLHAELLTLLKSLDADDWERQTVAPRWKVRDVAAHLLDGDLRKIAVYRDGHVLPLDKPIAGDRDLTDFINALNATGVSYAARLSPRLLVDLHAITGDWVAGLIESLPPHGPSIFSVSWAGEAQSENWMDTGREYTERWHHQMQIRDAAGRPLVLLEPQWMLPLLDLSLRALPHTYRSVDAPPGTAIIIAITGVTTAAWTLEREGRTWQIGAGRSDRADALVQMPADVVWRLLYNAPFDRAQVRIEGDAALAAPLLNTRSVIV